jgi:sec-independent protein translocase protein TatB
VFDLSLTKLLVLAVIGVVIFGPDQLPRVAAQAGRALRQLRQMAMGATEDLRAGLGPEFADFDLADLSPRNFVRKHLIEGLDEDDMSAPALAEAPTLSSGASELDPGESPPYDAEAT